MHIPRLKNTFHDGKSMLLHVFTEKHSLGFGETGETECYFYTDDGKGNGKLIFAIGLNDLQAAVHTFYLKSRAELEK